MNDQKHCACGKLTKNVSEFCKVKSRRDGFHFECISCKFDRYLQYKDKVFSKVVYNTCNIEAGKHYFE
jgi:hypothetical protein